VSRLKRVLAEKVLEVDFFTGALHKVEARRQRSGKTGAQAVCHLDSYGYAKNIPLPQ